MASVAALTGNWALFVRAGNLVVIRALLELGANADRLHPETHASPLLACCIGGHTDCVAALLEHGLSDLDKGSRCEGVSPVFAAAQRGHVEIVRALLFNGAEAEMEDANGFTPFMAACAAGWLLVAQALLDWGVEVDRLDPHGASAFHLACHNGRTDVARWLAGLRCAPPHMCSRCTRLMETRARMLTTARPLQPSRRCEARGPKGRDAVLCGADGRAERDDPHAA